MDIGKIEQKKKLNEYLKARIELKQENVISTMVNLWNYWLEGVKRIPNI